MIEIKRGSLDEQIIVFLQKSYPVTVEDLKRNLHLSKDQIMRVLKKFQIKGIVTLEPLPGKVYVRLLRNDFSFIGIKRQKKFIKHHSDKKIESKDYDGIMYN